MLTYARVTVKTRFTILICLSLCLGGAVKHGKFNLFNYKFLQALKTLTKELGTDGLQSTGLSEPATAPRQHGVESQEEQAMKAVQKLFKKVGAKSAR